MVFLTDFEVAAIDAIRAIFPETKVKGCSFHFRKAAMRHVGDEVLKTVYNTGVKSRIKTIIGMTQLLAFLIPIIWKLSAIDQQ